ncbi:MAG TPA: metal ABC transporter substrate-binding protein [bacterium]|nr:metal ABC transporter substrate-binding protein [bacterium]
MGYFLLKLRKFLTLFLLSKFCFSQTIICTTSILSSVVKDIAKDKVNVKTLVPPGICPGHFDIKIEDLKDIEKEGFIFAQGYEPYLEKIKKNIENPYFKIVLIETEGNSLLPKNQKIIYRKIFDEMAKIFPAYKEYFLKNFKTAEKEIDKIDKKIKEGEKFLKGKKAICNKYIKDLLEYFGFEIIETYGRKEELTPEKIKEIIEKCKIKKLDIVVDNLQAGKDTGKIFAEEFKTPHVVISNFPYAFENTETLRDTLYRDFLIIIQKF